MEKSFKFTSGLLYVDNNHHCYCTPWKIISPFVKKWSGNREPDRNRIKKMIAYHSSGGYLPRIIHLAELNNELVCYDGNHRREVFDWITDDNFQCIVDVIFNAKQKDILTAFKYINKSVQVPALYFDQPDVVKDKILALVKKYEIAYGDFLSISSSCHRPNFNRDTFVDNIDEIYKKFNNEKTIDEIELLLKKLNAVYAVSDHSKLTPKIINKCKKANFWLFSSERTVTYRELVLLCSK